MLLRQQPQTKRPGFTLMEIMVVVAIILILASAGVVVYTTMLADTRVNRARLDVKSLDQAITAYYLRKHYYPETLWVLTERDPVDNSPALLKDATALNDPWNIPYNYEPQNLNPKTDKPLIWTAGPPNSNMRITNWD